MAQKQFKIGLSNTDKQNMAQDVYERLLALTFPEYDTTTEYEVGDFVVYNDQLYKCIGATSGAWDSTKWQLATLNDLLTDIENAVAFVNDKANVNGNYPTMTVGFADNLTPYDESAGDDQDEPFSFQATGTGNGSQPDFSTGSGALMKEKQGNTVVVNQLTLETSGTAGYISRNFDSTTKETKYSWSSTSWVDGFLKFADTIIGHKILVLINNLSATFFSGLAYIHLAVSYSANLPYTLDSSVSNQSKSLIYTATTTTIGFRLSGIGNGTPTNNFLTAKIITIDLTQWFNGDIPQDILDNPSNFFRYYQGSLAYNAGELVNADGRYIKCIGRQQWDGEVANGFYDTTTGEFTSNNSYRCSKNKIRVNPNSDVYIYADDTVIVQQYDANGNMITGWSLSGNGNWASIGDNHFKVQPNCSYITWWKSTTDNIQITVSIYHEGETGYRQHYPYQVLTNNDTGTEVLRKAGNVCDIKLPSGEIKRNVGYVDLSTLDWSSGGTFWKATLSNVKIPEVSALPNAICSKYEKDTYMHLSGSIDGYFAIDNNGKMTFRDSAITLASQITGTLYYELAEPTTEQGTPFSENLAIDDFGSMDFGSDVPQGALIFYPVDYKAFIDTFYKYADGTPSNIALKSDLNNYQPIMQDLSSEITDAAGLTYTIKKAYKIGNQVFLTIKATNSTGNAISQFTSLASLGASIKPSTNLPVSSYIGETSARFIVHSDGYLSCASEIANDSTIYIVISYAVS